MLVFYDLPAGKSPLARTVVTIGNFDGVHLGHRAILARVVHRARELGGQAVAITFDPHPLKVLRPEMGLPLLTTPEQKLQLLAGCGLDAVVVLPFTPEFAAWRARDFVAQYFCERLRVREVVIGHDYCFGRGREGNIDLLKEMGALIRALLRLGKVAEAARLLGHPYGVAGEVVRGKGRGGKLLGAPTANIRPVNELLPASGIYAVRVRRGAEVLPGVANIGTCPTFDNCEFSLEVHLFDFNRDLYGENLEVDFSARLREERRFPSIEALAAQIQADIAEARQVLAAEE
ncbi:MAG: bifunctional riboflavin kinase/FMN adenylyltransferase [Deltaproteobacteria bacterium]|nr:bifunctional riboflavin kinase/FMN adenylyltransferase [Deltaproteobacteria bacterium]